MAKAIAKKAVKNPVAAVLSAQEKLEAFGIDQVCELTVECVPQRTIAKKIGVSWATFAKWLNDDPARTEQYARAREAQADTFVEDILSIADDGINDKYVDDNGNERVDQDVIARSRLRVDARKWLASKMAPKKYGDSIKIDADVKVTPKMDEVEARIAQLQALMAKK